MNNIEIIIKTLIEMYNLTQVDFAVKTEIPLPTIRKYLKSEFNPTTNNIDKIAETFNIDVKNLLESDIKNIESLEYLLYEYEIELKKIKGNIEVYDTDISIGDYNGHLKNLEYDPYHLLEVETEREKIFLNTIKFIEFLINKNIKKREIKILNDTISQRLEIDINKKIIGILKANNINMENLKDVSGYTLIKTKKNNFILKESELMEILNLLKIDISNLFENYLKLAKIFNEEDSKLFKK